MSRMILLLVDSHALVHRAYHAFPPLTTSKKELVSAVFGFSVMLLNSIKKFRPDFIACAFDEKGPTFREKEFVGYKAHREKMDKELEDQLDRVHQVVDSLNIQSFSKKGYEADDIIGSIIKIVKNKNKNIKVIVVSGDRDLLQLLDKDVFVALPGKSFADAHLWDVEAFKEKYGFHPKYYVDFKGLTGDQSDNIPGVKGIGEKSAVELIKTFKTIEEIYKNIDKVPEKFRKKLEGQQEIAIMSKKLSSIVEDIDINFVLEDCKVRNYDREKAVKLLRELEFSSLLKLLPPQGGTLAQVGLQTESSGVSVSRGFKGDKSEVLKGFKYSIANSRGDIEEVLRELNGKKEIVIDAESDVLNPIKAKMVGFSIFNGSKCWYIPVRFSPRDNALELLKSRYGPFSKRLISILENPEILKVGHNLKFDKHIFLNEGINLAGVYFDTLIAAYLLNVENKGLGLKNLAFTKLGIEMSEFEDLFTDSPNLYKEDLDILAKYCCMDAYVTYLVKDVVSRELEAVETSFKFDSSLLHKRVGKWSLFHNIEMPLVDVLVSMERNGVLVDKNRLTKLDGIFSEKINKIEDQIYRQVGHEFNPASPIQLAHVLFEELRLPFKKKGKIGYSTADSVLKKLVPLHPVVPLIREYREVSKLRSTYVKGLLQLLSQNDSSSNQNRVFTSFNQTATATGRLSSSSPNLQNIPIRTELGNEIRRCFIAPRGYALASFDYSQVELRVMAHVCRDKNLIDVFRKGIDVHKAAASTIFNIPVKNVSKDQRRVGKTVNFAVMYGMSEYGLSDLLGISEEEARTYISRYFEQFPGIRDYTTGIVEQIKKQGYVETLFGRRRNFAYRSGYNKMMSVIREAVNTPMQGTAADIMKLAMIEVNNLLKKFPFDVKMILQVHDELVFEVELENKSSDQLPLSKIYTDKNLRNFVPQIIDCMENVVNLVVPLDVDVEVGYNWADQIEVEPDKTEE